MLDFGLTNKEFAEAYETRFLNELVPGDIITGEIVVGDFKDMPMGNREMAEFYIIITDHQKHVKWICEFTTPYYPETDDVYGEKGGLFYSFFDSLNHVVNVKPENWQEYYTVNFNQFRKTINLNISSITIKAVESDRTDARTVNLQVTDVNLIKISNKRSSATIYDLAQEDPMIMMAYANLRNKGDRITIKNIQFELKSSLDDGKITENAYRAAFNELKKIKPTVDVE